MKKKTIMLSFLPILLTLLSCDLDNKSSKNASNTVEPAPIEKKNTQNGSMSSQAAADDIYAQMAVETCNCVQPLILKTQKLKDLEIHKQNAEMKQVVRDMELMRPQIQKCSDEIKRRFIQINDAESDKRLLNACIKQCPNMANLLQ